MPCIFLEGISSGALLALRVTFFCQNSQTRGSKDTRTKNKVKNKLAGCRSFFYCYSNINRNIVAKKSVLRRRSMYALCRSDYCIPGALYGSCVGKESSSHQASITINTRNTCPSLQNKNMRASYLEPRTYTMTSMLLAFILFIPHFPTSLHAEQPLLLIRS